MSKLYLKDASSPSLSCCVYTRTQTHAHSMREEVAHREAGRLRWTLSFDIERRAERDYVQRTRIAE